KALATGIGRPDLLSDARFADPAKLATNSAALTAILDEVFASRPMADWQKVLDQAHITYGVVREPRGVVDDPQLRANGVIVPLEGAGGKLDRTISSPIAVHDVTKVSAKRAPEIGEHNDEILREIGFAAQEIAGLRASGAVPTPKQQTKVSYTMDTNHHSTARLLVLDVSAGRILSMKT